MAISPGHRMALCMISWEEVLSTVLVITVEEVPFLETSVTEQHLGVLYHDGNLLLFVNSIFTEILQSITMDFWRSEIGCHHKHTASPLSLSPNSLPKANQSCSFPHEPNEVKLLRQSSWCQKGRASELGNKA